MVIGIINHHVSFIDGGYMKDIDGDDLLKLIERYEDLLKRYKEHKSHNDDIRGIEMELEEFNKEMDYYFGERGEG